jgi:hypothetical protein
LAMSVKISSGCLKSCFNNQLPTRGRSANPKIFIVSTLFNLA